jgi:protein-disulfide isomerase
MKEERRLENSALGSPRMLLALIAGAAIVVAALLWLVSGCAGGDGSTGGGGGGSASKEDPDTLYSGTPQNGTTLGESSAPVTLYLYEDFQCPYCGQFSRDTFPELVSNYVRDGKVKVVSVTWAFLGPDSVEAARAALAAGEQNRYWPYYSLLFDNQGEENSGYVTNDFLQDLAQKTPGLDVNKWRADLRDSSLASEVEAAESKVQADGVTVAPTLIISGPNGQEKLEGLHDYGQISETIEQVDGS